jgi:hypothetical protein
MKWTVTLPLVWDDAAGMKQKATRTTRKAAAAFLYVI